MTQLTYPFTESTIRALRAGDRVTLTGLIFTGRDRLHKYLADGGASPVTLRDGAIYHCGPVTIPDGDGWRVTAAGPTTSIREEPYMADIIATHGIRVILGKGGMGAKTTAACRQHGCVYLQAPGGAATLLAQRLPRVNAVHFLDTFGAAEALWSLDADAIVAIVGIDTTGTSLYDTIRENSAAVLKRLT